MRNAKRHVRMLTDGEEARLRKQIKNDPDSREPTDEQLASARPASEVLPPALYAALTRPRGRPKAEVTKVPVKLRLDPGVVAAFKATGDGWQTRMNATLARAAKRLAPALSKPVRAATSKRPVKQTAARKKRAVR